MTPFHVLYKTHQKQHIHAINETWNTFITQCLMIMLHDGMIKLLISLLTPRVLQSSPLKEISSQDYRMPKASS